VSEAIESLLPRNCFGWKEGFTEAQRLFQNPREPRRGEKREGQGKRRRRATKWAVDDE